MRDPVRFGSARRDGPCQFEVDLSRRPTIAELARVAGLSVATVDRVLNARAPVRAGTASRVAAAAEQIGYHAAGLLKQRAAAVPRRTFGFLLQKPDSEFYQALAAALTSATRSAQMVHGNPVVVFMDTLVPSMIAGRLRECGRTADALAVVAVDHPHVNEAIGELAARDVPTFALLSDLTAPSLAGFVGVDSRKAGRTAAWTIARLAREPGPVGVLVGTHRYLSQEIAEISFRTYFREHAPEFQILETVVDLEDDRIAYEATLDLLGRNRALRGIYLAGGGMHGMIQALRDEQAGRHVVAVCNELQSGTRAALIDGVVDLVLSAPLATLAARTVEAMAGSVRAGRFRGTTIIQLSAELFISENV